MASEQQAIAKSDEQHKEIMQELVEKAKSLAMPSKSNVAANQVQHSAMISMHNHTPVTINYFVKHDWFGSPIGAGYPLSIKNSSLASCTHVAKPDDGSEGAVIYSGTNKQGAACGWLLAWAALTTPHIPKNKVYVECGPISKYANIDWSAIQAKLNAASSTNIYMDPYTQTAIAAQIVSFGYYAGVGATFGAV